MIRITWLRPILLGCSLAGIVFAQPPAEPAPTAPSPREQVVNGFDRKAPKVGEPLPDVALLDAKGNEFRLSSLRGKYTVLVFGCLT